MSVVKNRRHFKHLIQTDINSKGSLDMAYFTFNAGRFRGANNSAY